jgi:Transposase DDE domain
MDTRVRGHNYLLDELKQHPTLGKLLCGVIPANEAVFNAHRNHQSILVYDPQASAGIAYFKLVGSLDPAAIQVRCVMAKCDNTWRLDALLGSITDEMLTFDPQQFADNSLCVERILLFDSWYASVDNLKLLQRLGLFFITLLKENRLVSLSKERGYIHLQAIEWTEHCLTYGIAVKLKEIPFKVQLFKVVAPNSHIEWVITNHPEGTITTSDIQDEGAGRWQIEQLHHELKQLTGSEKYECRKARSQRTHLA